MIAVSPSVYAVRQVLSHYILTRTPRGGHAYSPHCLTPTGKLGVREVRSCSHGHVAEWSGHCRSRAEQCGLRLGLTAEETLLPPPDASFYEHPAHILPPHLHGRGHAVPELTEARTLRLTPSFSNQTWRSATPTHDLSSKVRPEVRGRVSTGPRAGDLGLLGPGERPTVLRT